MWAPNTKQESFHSFFRLLHFASAFIGWCRSGHCLRLPVTIMKMIAPSHDVGDSTVLLYLYVPLVQYQYIFTRVIRHMTSTAFRCMHACIACMHPSFVVTSINHNWDLHSIFLFVLSQVLRAWPYRMYTSKKKNYTTCEVSASSWEVWAKWHAWIGLVHARTRSVWGTILNAHDIGHYGYCNVYRKR